MAGEAFDPEWDFVPGEQIVVRDSTRDRSREQIEKEKVSRILTCCNFSNERITSERQESHQISTYDVQKTYDGDKKTLFYVY